jgi:hypothetical protein
MKNIHWGIAVLLGWGILAFGWVVLTSQSMVRDQPKSSFSNERRENRPINKVIKKVTDGLDLANEFADQSLRKDSVRKESVFVSEDPPLPAPTPVPILMEPKFYTLDQKAFSELDDANQATVASFMLDYNAYYQEWSRSVDHNPVEWNRRMREFEEQIRSQLGPEAMDIVFH